MKKEVEALGQGRGRMWVDWGSTVVLLGGPCPPSSETQVPGTSLEKKQIHRSQMRGHPTPSRGKPGLPSPGPFLCRPCSIPPPGAKVSSLLGPGGTQPFDTFFTDR